MFPAHQVRVKNCYLLVILETKSKENNFMFRTIEGPMMYGYWFICLFMCM